MSPMPCITFRQVTNYESLHMSTKQNNNGLYVASKKNQNQKKLFAEKNILKPWSSPLRDVAKVALKQCRILNSECHDTICLPGVLKETRKS